MTRERETMAVSVGAAAAIGVETHEVAAAVIDGHYTVECWGPIEERRDEYIRLRDRYEVEKEAWLKRQLDQIPLELKWRDTIENVVTTVGKNNMLDNHLAGSSYTAAWFMGLISATSYTTGPAAGDTMASHGGWTEDTAYAAATRPAPSFAAASGGSKATSANVSFSMNATTTIKGCFLNSVNTKGGTTGTLFSAGLFTGGDQPVVNGNTLNVSYTATLT